MSRPLAPVVRPSLPAALWFAAGVWTAALAAEAVSWRVYAGLAPAAFAWLPVALAAVLSIVVLARLPSGLRMLAAGMCAGLVAAGSYWGWWRAEAARLPTMGAREWTGTAVEDPQASRGGWHVRAQLDSGQTVEVAWPSPEPPAYGQRVRFRGVMCRLASTDAYARSAAREGAVATAKVFSGGIVGWRAPPLGPFLAARHRLARSLEATDAGTALLSAVVLGDRRNVSASPTADEFRIAGLPHVLAASALYLGLVALLGQRLARRLRLSLPVQVALGCSAGLAYAAIAGFRPSMLRGLLAYAAASAVALAGRRRDALASVSLVAAALIVVSPPVALDLGLALGVCVVCGLALFGGLARRWALALLPDALAPTAPVLSAAAVAQLSAVPLAAGAFGMLSLVGPLSALVTVPLLSAGLVVGVSGGLLSLAAPAVGSLGLRAASVLFAAAARLVQMLASVPHAAVALGPLSAFASVTSVIALGCVWVLWPHPPRRRRARWLAACLAALLLLTPPRSAVSGSAQLVVMDVGQGDAILVRDGDAAMLVDCGPKPDVLRKALGRQGVRKLDCVVLTHAHADHTGGMPGLAGVVTVGWVGAPEVADREQFASERAAAAALAGPGSGWRYLRAGQAWRVGRTEVRVLWPRSPDASLSGNDTSVVLLVTRGAFRALLAGDAELGPQHVLAASGELPHADVLKVAHHGSTNGLDAPSLATVSPQVALISVGAANDYGHPHPQTIDLLRRAGVEIRRTDRDGDLTIDIGERSWSLERGQRRAACGTIVGARHESAAPSPLTTTERHAPQERPLGPQAGLPHIRRRGAAAGARGPPLA